MAQAFYEPLVVVSLDEGGDRLTQLVDVVAELGPQALLVEGSDETFGHPVPLRFTRALLEQVVRNQPVLLGVPVLANADFGHTSPMVILPIGGRASTRVGETSTLTIDDH